MLLALMLFLALKKADYYAKNHAGIMGLTQQEV